MPQGGWLKAERRRADATFHQLGSAYGKSTVDVVSDAVFDRTRVSLCVAGLGFIAGCVRFVERGLGEVNPATAEHGRRDGVH